MSGRSSLSLLLEVWWESQLQIAMLLIFEYAGQHCFEANGLVLCMDLG